ncbi:hypothetical protein Pcinc_033879 [Petrolisthes cinctipes]|uniref:Uncharacterized protein n=1 Tax=Petrolisthes cinctipes TaxID=88211 RepID=A0AAE1JWK8_PETCI|nr:hypothetical protein Pcinc_033879 [Petrolisthes cinctipes]
MEEQGGTLNSPLKIDQFEYTVILSAELRSPVLQETYKPLLFVVPLCSSILPSIYSNRKSITSYCLQ